MVATVEGSYSHPVLDWARDVLHASPPLRWAQGKRVARCYRTFAAVEDAGLRGGSHFGDSGPVTVIIEQGQLQLWCVLPCPAPQASCCRR